MNDEQVDYWVRLCPKELQRNENASSASVLAISDGPKRSCTTDMFVKLLEIKKLLPEPGFVIRPKSERLTVYTTSFPTPVATLILDSKTGHMPTVRWKHTKLAISIA